MSISASDLDEICRESEEMISINETYILETLGRDLIRGSSDQPPSYYIEIAKKWIIEKRSVIKPAICNASFIRSSKGASTAELVRLIVGILCKHFEQPAEISAISALLVKWGLDSWCRDDWTQVN